MSRRFLFLAIVALELAHTAVAVGQHRIPSGHDGFQYFSNQYVFLNNVIQSHEVPQWIPFMTEGTVATLWFGVQGSLLQNVLIRTGSLLAHVNLLGVYHVGMFIDAMILLVGTWLLASRFFGSTRTVFFIAVSILATCVWLDQPYWNFRLYYALPLVLELGHRFFDTGRWRWFFLAANLLALQTLGNLPYLVPLVSFAVFAYFLWYVMANPRAAWERVRTLDWKLPALSAVVFSVASFIVVYRCFTMGTEQLVSYNVGRNADGSTEMSGFLTYGGVTDLHKWIELVLNVSPWLDITLYSGILVPPLLLCGLISVDRRRLHFVLFAVTMLLFTLATPLTVALYYVWPGMKYFRHVGLVSPLVKVFLCFVAGIGFERLTEVTELTPARERWRNRAFAITGSVVLAGAGLLALNIARSQPAIARYVDSLMVAKNERALHTYDPEVLAHRLRSSATVAFAGAAILALIPIGLSTRRVLRAPVAGQVLVAGLLLFVVVDVYRFKFMHLADRSEIIKTDLLPVVFPASMPFQARRDVDLHQARLHNPRLIATLGFNQMLLRRFEGQLSVGAQYWSNNAFWFEDEVGSTLQADSWLEPLDELMRMYRGEALHPFPASRAREDSMLGFSLDRPGFGEVVGVSADKLRFFARAYTVPSADDFAPLMTNPAFRGNLLFALPAAAGLSAQSGASIEAWHGQVSLSDDETRTIPYQVRQFDSNNLVVSVFNPEPTGMWMSYADVWHPSWRATVDGRAVPVYRAEMAYKAVPIDVGENVIHFSFGLPLLSALWVLVSINSAFWLCAVGWMAWGLSSR